ncbi:PASTA domain-containing protein [Pseudonocardia sp. ICBG601]|uniref:PASTA domain-containing protein n=1 Tax=Pseudonocardia sp. ICBG601 TaxID=2846759 RepID=UPI0035ABFCAE
MRRAGLTPVRPRPRREFSAEVPAGAVIRTDPPAGTRLAGRRGGHPRHQPRCRARPAPTTAPPVARPRPRCRSSSGCAPTRPRPCCARRLRGRVERSFPFGRAADGVIGQDPGSGSDAEPGDTITLTVL